MRVYFRVFSVLCFVLSGASSGFAQEQAPDWDILANDAHVIISVSDDVEPDSALLDITPAAGDFDGHAMDAKFDERGQFYVDGGVYLVEDLKTGEDQK